MLTDGRTENRTPISHPATSRCDKKDPYAMLQSLIMVIILQCQITKQIDTCTVEYSRLLLSQLHLSRITAFLKVKIWSLI